MLKQFIRSLFSLLGILISVYLSAQDTTYWDNQMYLGNKIAFGKNQWKFSGELQTRLRNNFQSLDNWYLEFVSSYLLSEKIEIVPDFRFTVKPEKLEFRPALGFLYKFKNKSKIQFINQIKWQSDFESIGIIKHALREVLFINYKFNPNIILTGVSGLVYRWTPTWNGIQYIRVGPGFAYIFDDRHILNFSYFIGVENGPGELVWAGVPMLQLVINVNKTKDYKYKPAYYIDF